MAHSDSPGDDQTMELGETTGQLATYLSELTYDDLPEEAVELEKRHILDTLGCILYGTTTPWVQKVVDALEAHEETGRGSVSVPTTGIKLPPARAALVNGTASHSMDYDDYCQDAGVHAGSATIPVALAYAQTADRAVSGEEFLTAVAVGVETSIRSGYGIGRDSLLRGWHIAGWTGAFGGAATAVNLFELDEDRAAHALAVAATQGCGLMGAAYGSEVKRFHMGKAAEAGYLGAALAHNDFTGDTRIFADRWGSIGRTMSEEFDVAAVTEGLGETYELLEKLSFKPYPSTGQVHPPTDAVTEILEEQGLSGADIESVTIHVTTAAKDKAGWKFEPADVMSAQANIQYAVATLLVDDEITIEAYTPEAIHRPAVLDRIKDVEMVADDSLEGDDPAFDRYNTVVEVTTCDGETHNGEMSVPRGFPQNDMTEAELLTKFREQASYVLSNEAVGDVIEFVTALEDQSDVRGLFDLLE